MGGLRICRAIQCDGLEDWLHEADGRIDRSASNRAYRCYESAERQSNQEKLDLAGALVIILHAENDIHENKSGGYFCHEAGKGRLAVSWCAEILRKQLVGTQNCDAWYELVGVFVEVLAAESDGDA